MMHFLKHAAPFAAASILGISSALAQAPAQPVKIGLLLDLSGPYVNLAGPGTVAAAEMAAQDFGGSVLGQPVSIVAADTQLKTDVGVGIARRWFDEQGVTAIADVVGSGMALAIQELGKSKKRIVMHSSSSTDKVTNEQCMAYGAHWTFDSYSYVKTLASQFATPGSTWFFIGNEGEGGQANVRVLTPLLTTNGAKFIGGAYHPANTVDMSSFLLQAQSSHAQYIAMGNAGSDLVNTMKGAQEFGITKGQTMVALSMFLSDLKAMGLPVGGGLMFATGFAYNGTPEAAAWSKRFYERRKAMPNDVHAGVYSSVLHYLQAVKDAGSTDPDAVMAKMRETPVNDMFATNGMLRKDGLMQHDLWLVQAKTAAESQDPWDLIKVVKRVPAVDAFQPLAESRCPLLR